MHGTFSAGFSDWAWSPCLGTRRCSVGSSNARTHTHCCVGPASLLSRLGTCCTSRARTRLHRAPPRFTGRWGPVGLAALPHRCHHGPNALVGLLPPASLCHYHCPCIASRLRCATLFLSDWVDVVRLCRYVVAVLTSCMWACRGHSHVVRH